MTLGIVTGAARGIGRANAEKLADVGHQTVLVDVNPDVEQTTRDIGAVAVHADITDPGIECIAEVVSASNKAPSILVNNAGITRDSQLRNMSEDDFRLVLRINLEATFAVTEKIAPLLMEGGSIVNLTSRGQLGNIGQFNYAVSKGGVIGLTRAHALKFAPRLRVNAVGSGLIESEMTKAMPKEADQKVLETIPLTRAGLPSEIGDVVAWLASSDSCYMTRETIYVAGGRNFS